MAESPLVLYVLGEPGIGKTTTVRFLLQDARIREQPYVEQTYTKPPAPKWTIARDVVAAGLYQGMAFDGADTIPYNGARAALEYWRDNLAPTARLTVLDGARFSTKPSLAFLRELGATIVGVHLVAANAAAERRSARATAAGVREQSKNWVKGAASGAYNFAAAIGAHKIDANRTALLVASDVFAFVEKVRTECARS